ncbi:MAG: lipocalin family protein [Pseudomonadota bacterium]|uniref:lipocalin family protein n=1 Tax=Roseovarius TaxID=74030 RepID=UPI0022A82776|nr:lipocalin family protein [Roseovarius sp. EGI FJ00037]MCZ0812488.1 lipocalin family protein [Roseovarius sp. EGI FJ00037]
MMRRLGLLSLLFLAACASAPTGPGYRDTGQPLSVTTRSDHARLSGDWVLRATTPPTPEMAGLIAVGYNPGETDRFTFTRRVCDADGACETRRVTRTATVLGPNRWRLSGPSGALELWVVWVDEGYRTAAIGTPDGSFGWVLDRAPSGGADRITAAREILEFNGYAERALGPRQEGDDT